MSGFSIQDRLCALWRINRPIDGIAIGLGLSAALVVAGSIQFGFPFRIYIYMFLGGFFVSSHAMVQNDIIDVNIDKINEPQRPLPAGLLQLPIVRIYSIFLGIIGIFFFTLVDTNNLSMFNYVWVYALIHLLIADFYSWKLKKTGIPGNITVAWTAYTLFLLADLTINGGFTLVPQIVGIMGFSVNLSREIFKGIIDTEGDREYGVKTIAVKFGERSAKFVAMIFLTLCILIGGGAFFYVNLIGKIGLGITLLIYSYTLFIARNAEDPEISRTVKTLILLGPLQLSPFLIIDQIFIF